MLKNLAFITLLRRERGVMLLVVSSMPCKISSIHSSIGSIDPLNPKP